MIPCVTRHKIEKMIIYHLIKLSERSERAVGIEGGSGGDGPYDVVGYLTPPRVLDE